MISSKIDNILFAATTGLFKAYGQPLSELPAAAPTQAQLCAVIGFTGKALSGAVMLAADVAPIHATRPVPETSDRDWIAELANQLLGRLKNRLLNAGVEIWATTPVVMRGERMAPVGGRGALPSVSFVTPSGGRVTTWVDHQVHDAATLAKLVELDEPVTREGELVLF